MSSIETTIAMIMDVANDLGMNLKIVAYGGKGQNTRFEAFLFGGGRVLSTPDVGHDSVEDALSHLFKMARDFRRDVRI